MPKFRKPRKIDLEAAKATIENASGEFVLFTGTVKRNARRASGRTAALGTITEKRKVLPLSTLLDRAAKIGFDPAFTRSGLVLAARAVPAVYFLLYRDEKGNYRSTTGVASPDPTFSPKPFAPDAIVLAAKGAKEEAEAKAPTPKSEGSEKPSLVSLPAPKS